MHQAFVMWCGIDFFVGHRHLFDLQFFILLARSTYEIFLKTIKERKWKLMENIGLLYFRDCLCFEFFHCRGIILFILLVFITSLITPQFNFLLHGFTIAGVFRYTGLILYQGPLHICCFIVLFGNFSFATEVITYERCSTYSPFAR